MDWRGTMALLRFGGWDSIFTGLSALLTSADRFVIGWLLGAGDVATYAIPYSVIQRTQFIRGALLRTLFPKLSGTSDPEARHALAMRMLKATMGVTAVISIPVLVLVEDALALWIGPEFAASAAPVTKTLVVAFWIVTLLRTLFIFQVASARPDVPASVRLVSALPFLALLAGMVSTLGVLGAALSLVAWWSLELSHMLARVRMLRHLAGAIAAWAALWAVGMAVALAPLPLAANVVLAGGLGAAALALSLAQSPDLARLARKPLERLARRRPRSA
jgi:O-antigen/teichoic acid export membrane protein